MAKATYKDAGVDLEVYRESMSRLPRLAHRTFSPRVMKLDGGFAGLFRLDFGNKLFSRNYKDPVLVSGTDGVGTKLKVAVRVGRHDTVGEDLVNHCVNDIAVGGARPLFFLDYFSTGTLNPDMAEQVIRGFARGCKANGCALIGGETAEMPDLYRPGDYDLAGFAVGAVERGRRLPRSDIAAGDVVLGLASSGVHANRRTLKSLRST